MGKTGILVLAVLFFTFCAKAATFTTVASGNWSSSATWSGGNVPSNPLTTGDQVIIATGNTVTMDANVTINNALAELNVAGTLTGSATTYLTVSSGTVSGAGTINTGYTAFSEGAVLLFTGNLTTAYLNSSALTLKTLATVVVSNTMTLGAGVLSLETGGTLTLSTGATIMIAGGKLTTNGGTLALSSNYNVSYTTASATTGAELTGNGLQSVTINVPSGQNVNLSNDLTVGGTLALTSGTLVLNDKNLTITGDVTSTGGTISSTATSNISIATTSKSLTGTLAFNGTTNSANNFTINVGSGNNAQMSGTLVVKGMLSLTSGMLNIGSSSTLDLQGNISSNGSGTISSSTGSTINIKTMGSPSGGLAFTSGANTVSNLNVNIVGGGTMMINSDVTVTGTLQLTTGNLDIGGHTITIASTGILTSGSITSYIITSGGGSLAMALTAGNTTTVTYPIGTSTHYFPANIWLNNGSASGNVTAGVASGILAQGTAGASVSAFQPAVDATWNIHSDITTNLNLTMELIWSPLAEVNGFDRTNAYVSHYINGAWDVNASASAIVETGGTYGMKRSNLTSLSPFAVFDHNTKASVEVAQSTEMENAYSIYPNPANNMVYIAGSISSSPLYVDVCNAAGKVMGTYRVVGNNYGIDVSTLTNGVYFMKFYDSKSTMTKEFIKM